MRGLFTAIVVFFGTALGAFIGIRIGSEIALWNMAQQTPSLTIAIFAFFIIPGCTLAGAYEAWKLARKRS